MFRVATSAALIALLTAPAVAADWDQDWSPGASYMRGGYSNEPKEWSGLNGDDGIAFEFGTRYWYSWGAQNFDIGGATASTADTAHSGELHLRIDDYASRSYVKGLAGYSIAINGTYDDPSGPGTINDGHVGYAGADFGWNAFGDGQGSGMGLLLGYLYWNDSPRTDRANFTTATSGADIGFDPDTGFTSLPFDSTDNDLNINALRLGVSGRAKLGDMFDISGELAAVPYAAVGGVMGGIGMTPVTCGPLGNICLVGSSPTSVNGWGYGAMGELMVGVTPVENLTFRVGGRAWYLQGTVDAEFSVATIGDPTDSNPPTVGPAPDFEVTPNAPNFDTPPSFSNQGVISTANPFSLFRFGLLAEVTYSF